MPDDDHVAVAARHARGHGDAHHAIERGINVVALVQPNVNAFVGMPSPILEARCDGASMRDAVAMRRIHQPEFYFVGKVFQLHTFYMYDFGVPILGIERVGDFGRVEVVCHPGAIVEKDDLVETVVGVERVERRRNEPRNLNLAFHFLLFLINAFLVDFVAVVLFVKGVDGHRIGIDVYGVVNDENLFQAAEKALVVLREGNRRNQGANNKQYVFSHLSSWFEFGNKGAKVRKIPNLA